MTAFLALIFILLVSFVGSLMESASIQMAKNYRRTDMDRAMESVFAEYQKDLLEEFDVFGLDGSYENGDMTEELLLGRLSYYGAGGIDNQIQAIRLLTDQGGKAYREQVAKYIEEKYGVNVQTELEFETGEWEEYEEKSQWIKETRISQELHMDQLLSGNQVELPEENNPLRNIELLQKKPLLDLVTPKDIQVSEKAYNLSDAVSLRNKRKGYGDFSTGIEEKEIPSLVFGEYLLSHFASFTENKEKIRGEGLEYEMEYILFGMESDKENLEKVTKKLLMIRLVSNYIFLTSDSVKKAEAEAMAATLSTVILLPEITAAVTPIILLAWAFGESLIDIRSLLDGKKVALVKNEDSWQTSISSLFTLGTETDHLEGTDNANGLTYNDYLRMILFLQEKVVGKEQITMRSLDMIEKRLRYDKGQEWFKADACISKLEIKSICSLRRGVTYQFYTYFGYQ